MNDGFRPVAVVERIQALDVVRGVALLGIALMNVEFFNRPLAALGDGLPEGLHGPDQWAAMFIHLFVRTKFFTMFSILFGMGFAVMLARAQAAGRPFLSTYVRRTLALALFGLVHGILIWGGDILLSYANAALLLLAALFARGWLMWLVFVVPPVVGFAVGATGDAAFATVVLLLDATVLALLRRGGPSQGQRLHGARLLRAGVILYLVPALLMAVAGGLTWLGEARAPAAGTTVEVTAETAKRQVLAAEQQAQRDADVAREAQVMSQGDYFETVAFRAPRFLDDFARSLFFLGMAAGLFMIGAWLLQTGAMGDPARHLPLHRTFVWVALPLGLAATLVSAFIATNGAAGHGRWLLTTSLQFAGGMPMSLGYIGLLVLALQREAGRRLLGWVAPAGRMALTNYIGQSVLCSLVFYGHGLGHWGLPRAQQVLFVLAMFALQALASRWWLARFRYGPLEWLWRWATYGRRPAMRVCA